MDNTNSQSRPPAPSPALDETRSIRAGEMPLDKPSGASSSRKSAHPGVESPTIITTSPPVPSPAATDSVNRILDGRVMLGDRLGHFELVEYVGGGGMGRVFRAIDTRLGRQVALKILPPELAAGADALQRFHNEAQSAARLDHENIARVYYVGEDRGLAFIVFEFVEGQNVRTLVEKNGPLSLGETLSYGIQTAEALAHADTRGVVHRDIKPSNVLITPQGRVKLIDMGLARLRDADMPGGELTQSGMTLGTFDYISPEQARDPRNADARSDIYSLGCTMFFMLTGHPPFPEGTLLQKLLQHQGDEPPDVRQSRPELPEGVSRLLVRMMAKDPKNRPANSAELAKEMMTIAEQAGLSPLSAGIVSPLAQSAAGSKIRRHLPWLIPAATLAVIVALVDVLSNPRDAVLPPTLTPANNKSSTIKPAMTAAVAAAKKHTRPTVSAGSANASATTEGTATVAKSSKGRTLVVGENKPPKGSKIASVPEKDVFPTLAAACAAARNDDAIELRYNGPREERPLKITNLQAVIRAGDGYHPTILFRPAEATLAKDSLSMMTLTAGRLSVSDVGIELVVPRDVPADHWSLLETCGGQTLSLERCTLTVSNASDQLKAYHQEAAFIRTRPLPDADAGIDDAPAATPLATFELTDCVARGEAVFLFVEDMQPVTLKWENGLLATTEQLLYSSGGAAAPKSEEAVHIDLHHVTALVRGGLCRLTASPLTPFQQAVQFTCDSDIFIGASGVPLIEQDGVADAAKARQQFVWSGNRVFYQDVDVFWTIRNADARISPDVMTFDGWKTYWRTSRENQPSVASLFWRQTPDETRPLHTYAANDYTLSDPTFSDAAEGAPGLQYLKLPMQGE